MRERKQQDWKETPTTKRCCRTIESKIEADIKRMSEKHFLKSTSNIVQRKLVQHLKPFRLYRFHLIHSTIDVCVCVGKRVFMMSAAFFRSSIFAVKPVYTQRDLLVFYVRAMLNSKLAKFNKISTQSQLRSNSLDFILSQLLLTSSLCMFASAICFFFCSSLLFVSSFVRKRQRQKCMIQIVYRWKGSVAK